VCVCVSVEDNRKCKDTALKYESAWEVRTRRDELEIRKEMEEEEEEEGSEAHVVCEECGPVCVSHRVCV